MMDLTRPVKKMFRKLYELSHKSKNQIRVLVVDDSEDDRLLIEKAILRVIDRTRVDEASDALEAMTLLASGDYDAVVTDQLLPGGFTSRDVARFAQRRGIPTFTVSAEPNLFAHSGVIDKMDLYTA